MNITILVTNTPRYNVFANNNVIKEKTKLHTAYSATISCLLLLCTYFAIRQAPLNNITILNQLAKRSYPKLVEYGMVKSRNISPDIMIKLQLYGAWNILVNILFICLQHSLLFMMSLVKALIVIVCIAG
ncbi:hypothetical protein [Rickettsia sp. TH2014]|uniref:hypothetical protein n=1 Tax=Rickettsia sp. TH2014 TaxID=1967503 RepID=UPI001C43BE79|nr:hypothetical protein [Rickettsia sp. TH2014]